MISLAYKNIIKNKKDSLIVILLITVITFLFFIGNTIIGKASRSLRSSYIESLTGEVVLQKKSQVTMNLFGANAAVIEDYFNIPIFPSSNEVLEILRNEKNIAGFTPLVTGSAYMDLLDIRHPVLLCGIDPVTYFDLFPGIILLDGNFLIPEVSGAMITEDLAKDIQNQTGRYPEIGMPFMFTSGGDAGFRIREVPLTGIFRYTNPGQFMKDIVILGAQTVRDLNSIRTAEYIDAELPDIDSFFVDNFSLDDSINEVSYDTSLFSTDYLINVLGSQTERVLQMDGDWHFILIRLNNAVVIGSFINFINKRLEPYDIMAVDWRIASGISSILTLLIQFLFNAGILLISITGIIAIINILLIYIFRRVKEIGTLRAIGATDSFIRKLIYSENIVYSCTAGIISIFVGSFFLRWFNGLGITITNNILINLFNGNILHFDFMFSVAVSSFMVAVILGLASSVYPVEVAVKIKPIVAVQRG